MASTIEVTVSVDGVTVFDCTAANVVDAMQSVLAALVAANVHFTAQAPVKASVTAPVTVGPMPAPVVNS